MQQQQQIKAPSWHSLSPLTLRGPPLQQRVIGSTEMMVLLKLGYWSESSSWLRVLLFYLHRLHQTGKAQRNNCFDSSRLMLSHLVLAEDVFISLWHHWDWHLQTTWVCLLGCLTYYAIRQDKHEGWDHILTRLLVHITVWLILCNLLAIQTN